MVPEGLASLSPSLAPHTIAEGTALGGPSEGGSAFAQRWEKSVFGIVRESAVFLPFELFKNLPSIIFYRVIFFCAEANLRTRSHVFQVELPRIFTSLEVSAFLKLILLSIVQHAPYHGNRPLNILPPRKWFTVRTSALSDSARARNRNAAARLDKLLKTELR